jgi:hypothetical protein
VQVRITKAAPDEPRQSWTQFKPQKRVTGQEPKRGRWRGFVAGKFRIRSA